MKKVLLIDDSKTVIAAVSRHLRTAGYEVLTPANFVEIPKLISKNEVAAIILDLNMPSLSGEQIGDIIQRGDYKGKVIIYSGETEKRLVTAAERLNAAFVSKDDPLSKLVDAIRATGGKMRPQML